ncbi:uncharacterized protein LOC124260205 [Haliotis rubra]|uniref:uncharacterized protein LOC124260205 n=1 Tax=Haliotis rubra TaxID=36100 RepID=UPI001EE60C32|nr:uncharacterized protein LOC124260205 [Haliotis rubra]
MTRMSRSSLYILALWWTCSVDSTSVIQECSNYHYTQASTLDNQLFFHRLLWEKNSTKKLECATFCFQEKTCVSFQVNTEESVCRGYAVTFNPTSTSDSAPGYVLYESKKAVGFIGSSCQNNSECTVPDSVCVNSECMCDPGLSFSPLSATCNATCTSYGPHYTAVHGYHIGHNNMATFREVTRQQCREHCSSTTNFVCRSADWANGRCDLTSATLKTVHANNYFKGQDKELKTHFVRECEI